jgi:hypothetical protein
VNQQIMADEVTQLGTFVRQRLPRINVDWRDGRMTRPEWARLVRPKVDGVEVSAAPNPWIGAS